MTKFKILPLQLNLIEGGIFLKRGCTILKIQGDGAQEAVESVLSALNKHPLSHEEVTNIFPVSARDTVQKFLDMLTAKRFLVPVSGEPPHHENKAETPLDIFYWDLGRSTVQVEEVLCQTPLTILGLNYVSLRLIQSLPVSGFKNIHVVDHPLFRNLKFFDQEGRFLPESFSAPSWYISQDFHRWERDTDPQSIGCLIATADFGSHSLFREWNRFCVKHDLPFFPICLKDAVGCIGPLIIPGETACWECFLARGNSHKLLDNPYPNAFEAETFSPQSVYGFHPSMASILGDIATVELTKFYGGRLPGWNVGTAIEVNLLSSRMTPRKVLKIPRCPVCSPLLARPSTNLYKDVYHSPSRSQG